VTVDEHGEEEVQESNSEDERIQSHEALPKLGSHRRNHTDAVERHELRLEYLPVVWIGPRQLELEEHLHQKEDGEEEPEGHEELAHFPHHEHHQSHRLP